MVLLRWMKRIPSIMCLIKRRPEGQRRAQGLQRLYKTCLTLSNARVVYATATGETEVENLAMLSRLPLWGMRTAFKTMDDFMAKMKSGGTSAMELVARDMKAMGVYLARSPSFRSGKYSDENVTYSRLEYTSSMIIREQFTMKLPPVIRLCLKTSTRLCL